jgi:hypothetical protein
MHSSTYSYFCFEPGDGSSGRPWCLVDMSSEGARLQVENPNAVPDSFMLVQRGEVTKVWHCRVVWKSLLYVGVKFE